MPTRNVTRSIQLHPLTSNWVDRVRLQSGTVPDHKLAAVDQLVKRLVSLGLYSDNAASKIQYLLIFSASSGFTGSNVPLIDISRVGNAVLNNYVAANWSDSGIAGNESNFYTDTKWSPSLSPMLATGNGHLLIWKTIKAATTGINGGSNSVAGGEWTLGRYFGVLEITLHGSASAGDANLNESFDSIGCHLSSRIGTSLTYRRDGVLSNNVTVTGVGTICSISIYLNALNDSGTPQHYHSDRIFCNSMGDGLTANQCSDYFDALSLLQDQLAAI